jgi:two-component system, OmpR family, response regulator TctD
MSVDQRLLLVTTDDEVGRALGEAFGGALAVTVARSAEEALQALAARYYAFVLADFALPDRDGGWLLTEVKRIAPWARRVLVSATAVPGLTDLSDRGVVELFAPKPFDPEELRPYVPPAPAGR